MALAQPTGLQVQELEPFASIEQEVWRYVVGDCDLLTEAGDELLTESGDSLAAEPCTVPLIGVTQYVGDNATLVPAYTLATLDQTTENYSDLPRQVLIGITQDVERYVSSRTLLRARQYVLSPATAAEPQTFVVVGGVDVTDQTSRDLRITASEGDNRTASVRLVKLAKGPLDVPAYQGQAVEITRLINGAPVVLFTGYVERPTYNRDSRSLLLECSDLRNERLGKEDRDQLKAMTGGLFSSITQRDDATGSDWVAELMKTVPGSLDYTSAGVLRYSPWAVGTPAHVLQGNQVHYREVDLEFSTRSEIVNTVSASLEYRYFQRNTLSHAVSLSVETNNYCKLAGCLPATQVEDENGDLVPQILPTKNALRSAAESVSGWSVGALSYIELPPDGWYRNGSDVTQKRAWGASELIRSTRAMGADVTLERYISQPKRESYDITVTAPQSVDQYGEIEGGDMRFAIETRVDPSIFEERGCTVTPDADDRRADVEQAITIVQRMAEKQILASHRQNYAGIRFKPGNNSGDTRGLLPVEIGQTIELVDDEVSCIGTVTEFQHAVSGGDYWTDIKLAVSRVESAVSVTEDWTLPAAPTKYALNSDSQALPETPDCPAPAGEVQVEGDSRIEPDGTVIIVAPSIDRSLVDEIQGTREHTYSVAIPIDQLQVEVV